MVPAPEVLQSTASATRKEPRQLLRWTEQVAVVLNKDLRIEARSGELVVTSGFFAILVVVLSSLSFWLGPTLRGQVAAAVIWLATAFAAVLSLGRSWQREREHGAFAGILVAPIQRSAVFAAKALGLLLFLAVMELVVVPVTALFFSIDLVDHGAGILLIAATASPGIAAASTLFGVMTVRTSARDLILAVVLFPLLAPTLICAVLATRLLFDGGSTAELGDYILLMTVFDVVFVAGGLGMFGSLTDG